MHQRGETLFRNRLDEVIRHHADRFRTILVERARLAATREPTAPRAGATGAPGEPAIGEHAFDVLMLERALQQLEQHDERAARVVVMSCFGGMQRDEIAVAASITLSARRRTSSAAFGLSETAEASRFSAASQAHERYPAVS